MRRIEYEGVEGWFVPDYGDVPSELQPSSCPSRVPNLPGVYFIWDAREVVYVGESKNLEKRITRKHRSIKRGDMVSWQVNHDRLFAEAFYIGLLKPSRNFGNRT